MNKKLLLVGVQPDFCSVCKSWVWLDFRLEILRTTSTPLLCFSRAEAHFVTATVVDSWQQLWLWQWWRRAQTARYVGPITGIFSSQMHRGAVHFCLLNANWSFFSSYCALYILFVHKLDFKLVIIWTLKKEMVAGGNWWMQWWKIMFLIGLVFFSQRDRTQSFKVTPVPVSRGK
jgi:hypothetical protein